MKVVFLDIDGVLATAHTYNVWRKAIWETLRTQIIRVAYTHAHLRPVLLPLLERVATEFPTQEALDKYLKDHPQADASKHSVKGKGDGASSSRGWSDPSKPPKKVREAIKDVSDKLRDHPDFNEVHLEASGISARPPVGGLLGGHAGCGAVAAHLEQQASVVRHDIRIRSQTRRSSCDGDLLRTRGASRGCCWDPLRIAR